MKTINRDALLDHLESADFDEQEESTFLAGFEYATRKVARFPSEERYTLQEAAQKFLKLGLRMEDAPPQVGLGENVLITLQAFASGDIDENEGAGHRQ